MDATAVVRTMDFFGYTEILVYAVTLLTPEVLLVAIQDTRYQVKTDEIFAAVF